MSRGNCSSTPGDYCLHAHGSQSLQFIERNRILMQNPLEYLQLIKQIKHYEGQVVAIIANLVRQFFLMETKAQQWEVTAS